MQTLQNKESVNLTILKLVSYRGDIGVILENRGFEPFKVEQGDRIAQFVLQEVPQIEWVSVDSLDETDRGEGGYSSTGVK